MGTFTITQRTPNRERLYLYPNNDISNCTEWTPNGDSTNWRCVDDNRLTPDYDSTYISMASDKAYVDLLDIQDNVGTGNIDYIRVHSMARSDIPERSQMEYYVLISTVTEHYYDPGSLEDYTTYTEVEEGDDNITVMANHIYYHSDRTDTDYVYKDFGANHFSTVTHCFACYVPDKGALNAYAYFWAMSDELGDSTSWNNSLEFFFRNYNGAVRFFLKNTDSVAGDQADFYVGSESTWYYVKIHRDGVGNVTAEIYSDAAMTVLLDTLTVNNDTTTREFRYLYAIAGRDTGNNISCDVEVKNLSLTCGNVLSACGYFESDLKYLTTAWRKTFYTWDENPSTGNRWNWSQISNLAIGIKAKSYTIPTLEQTTTIRPSGHISTQLEAYSSGGESCPATNWACVENSSDNCGVLNGTFAVASKADVYNLDNTGLPGATPINSVTVFGRMRAFTGCGVTADDTGRLLLKTGGLVYFSDLFSLTNNFELYSHTWTNNPNTGVAWTVADIEALLAGVELTNDDMTADCGYEAYSLPKCSYLYVVVNYSIGVQVEVQCTQLYAEIGYSPSTVTCILSKPQEISTSHDRNSAIINFWNGDREVFDISRSGKSMVLTGSEYGADINPCSRITCIRNIARNGAEIEIGGLNRDFFNGNYRILQFGWNLVSEKPVYYKWFLELESAD